jgi:hypothetical protein
VRRRPDLTGQGTEMLAMAFSKSFRIPGDPLRHAHSSPIHDQLIGFMLASDTTMQIHFIDILAIADVESDGLLLDAAACDAVMMDIGNVTAWRNHQP